jgi:GNAT superfamily N-acetyltransferase
MDLIERPYASDHDYWRIRDFLRRLRPDGLTHPESWHVLRWDYWRWHGVLNIGDPGPEATATLWETAGGEIAAVVNGESRGNAFFQVDPAHRTRGLDSAMLDAAERRIACDGRLVAWAAASDTELARHLAERGFAPTDDVEHERCRALRDPVPEPHVPEGYRIRPLGGDEDFPARGDLSLRVFHPVPDGSMGMTADDYRNIQRGPLYRRDLDLVAEADDGTLVAFATFWFDDVTRTVEIEPVGTDAPHRRRGLSRALLLEGMRRARWMGAEFAHIGSYSEEAHATYASVGLETIERFVAWERPRP